MPSSWEPATEETQPVIEFDTNTVYHRLMNCGSAERLAFIRDTRSAHREIYLKHTSPQTAIFAGGYRGMHGTSLAGRESFCRSFIKPDTKIVFCKSSDVIAALKNFSDDVDRCLANADIRSEGRSAVVQVSGLLFQHFGMIHPYVNGNGHVQRLILSCIVKEFGYSMTDDWTCHRTENHPYGPALLLYLEIDGKLPPPLVQGQLIGEYLTRYIKRQPD